MTWTTRLRYLLVHLSWVVVLLAGAAVPLAEALDLSSWVVALLGFTVVAFQGVDRLFDRTSRGSEAMDRLRRGLAREQRLLLVGGGDYAAMDAAADRAKLFVERCERLLGENDATMVEYFANLTGSPVIHAR